MTDLQSLFANSGLDAGALSTLALAADTFGPAITAGLGTVGLDDIDASEVLLVTLLIDDSSSIRMVKGNSEAIRKGHNEMLTALRGSKSSAAILVGCRYLNGTVLYPYVPLDKAPDMDQHNYNPNGGTPLYDNSVVTLGSVTAKVSELEQGGIAVRAVTYVFSDGADCGSRSQNAGSVRGMVDAMLRTESHIIGGVGISDAGDRCYACGENLNRNPLVRCKCPACGKVCGTDFFEVYNEMGIQDDWILTAGNTDTDIRRAFGVVSQSAVRASQTAGSFSQTALGGFGN